MVHRYKIYTIFSSQYLNFTVIDRLGHVNGTSVMHYYYWLCIKWKCVFALFFSFSQQKNIIISRNRKTSAVQIKFPSALRYICSIQQYFHFFWLDWIGVMVFSTISQEFGMCIFAICPHDAVTVPGATKSKSNVLWLYMPEFANEVVLFGKLDKAFGWCFLDRT